MKTTILSIIAIFLLTACVKREVRPTYTDFPVNHVEIQVVDKRDIPLEIIKKWEIQQELAGE